MGTMILVSNETRNDLSLLKAIYKKKSNEKLLRMWIDKEFSEKELKKFKTK